MRVGFTPTYEGKLFWVCELRRDYETVLEFGREEFLFRLMCHAAGTSRSRRSRSAA